MWKSIYCLNFCNIGFKLFNIFRQHLFYGSYEKKVSVVALAKLLQHGVNNNDTRLQVRKYIGSLKWPNLGRYFYIGLILKRF